ncbi:MAG TPA: YfiR family protein [Gammaproteobacteria bacterium]
MIAPGALAARVGRVLQCARAAARAWRGRTAATALAVLLVGASAGTAQNVPRTASEDSVKAAYLFKFPAYVDWPDGLFQSAESALTIGVVESDRLADALAVVAAGRRVDGRPVRVRRLSPDDPPTGVHVLFLPAESAVGTPIAEQADGLPILTVGEQADESSGIVVSFVPVGGRVRFEVDLEEAGRRGLRLHSGMLAVAERVRGAPR